MASSNRWSLVFDIGGTNLRAALYDGLTDSLHEEIFRPTPSHFHLRNLSAEEIRRRLLAEMESIASRLCDDREVSSIAVAFPGPVDAQGNVLAAPTVWGDLDRAPFPLLASLRSIWPTTRLFVMNDVTAAGYRYLADRDEDLCVITVSSGIGHKVFIKGRPAVGARGRGGEIGHVQVDTSRDAPVCECGGRGHLGAIASGRGALFVARRLAEEDLASFRASVLGRRFGTNVKAMDNPDLVEAFRQGDAWARSLIRRVAGPLGRIIATIHATVGVEKFVIIGGFALALGEDYRRELVLAASESCWDLGQEWDTIIRLGVPDDLSGLIGAGRLATVFNPGD